MSAPPLLDALRLATAETHEALERDADIEQALRSAERRPQMVARFLTLHRAVDQALEPWRDTIAGLGFVAEPRSAQIDDDLAELGADRPAASATPRIGSLGEALGWLYVAEGSMLGGRVMRKAMRRDGIGLTGLSFLDPHGDQTAPRWQRLIAALDAANGRGLACETDVVRGGRDAFALARRLLAPEIAEEVAA